jgi:hypothetical protein
MLYKEIIVVCSVIQYDYQEIWFTGNLKEGNNDSVPGVPGKMKYIQPWMEEI